MINLGIIFHPKTGPKALTCSRSIYALVVKFIHDILIAFVANRAVNDPATRCKPSMANFLLIISSLKQGQRPLHLVAGRLQPPVDIQNIHSSNLFIIHILESQPYTIGLKPLAGIVLTG